MTTRSALRLLALLAVGLACFVPSLARADEPAKKTPPASAPTYVMACYFHRTQRCPTCLRISAYIEDSIKERFVKEVKDGKVKMAMVDFQNPDNAKFTEAYQIQGPTLVILNVKDGKVKEWKPAPRVWVLVKDKESFAKYVETEVRAFLDAK